MWLGNLVGDLRQGGLSDLDYTLATKYFLEAVASGSPSNESFAESGRIAAQIYRSTFGSEIESYQAKRDPATIRLQDLLATFKA